MVDPQNHWFQAYFFLNLDGLEPPRVGNLHICMGLFPSFIRSLSFSVGLQYVPGTLCVLQEDNQAPLY